MNTITEENGIRKERTVEPIMVKKVENSEFQKSGTISAEIRQTVNTKTDYPATKIVSSLQDSIFSADDFEFEQKSFNNSEIRVAWIDVPEGSTKETVEAKLETLKGANLYRMLSNKPILSDNQLFAVSNDAINVSNDTFANRQVVRYPKGHDQEGNIALDRNGKVQYRAIFFSKEGKTDKDLRTPEPANYYASVEIEAELNNEIVVVAGQTLN